MKRKVRIAEEANKPMAAENMPMMAGRVGQYLPEPRPDPNWEEGNRLREEANRALKRLLVHSVTMTDNAHLTSVTAKALEALRGW